MRSKLRWQLGLFLIVLSPFASAHHFDRSKYDPSDAIVLSGTVVDFSFTNPHAILHLEAENRVGNLATFEIELGSTLHLSQHGIRQDTFKAGDQLTVTVWRQRANNFWRYWGRGFRMSDGTAMGEIPPEQ